MAEQEEPVHNEFVEAKAKQQEQHQDHQHQDHHHHHEHIHDQSSIPQSEAKSDVPTWNIYLGELGADVAEEDLMQVFSSIGSIHSVSVARDKQTGASKHYGFVNFLTEDARDKALVQFKEVKIKSQVARCFRSDSKNTVYIGNIPSHISDAVLQDTLVKIAGPFEKFTKKHGFCFVEYVNFRQAEKAALLLKNQTIEGNVLKVQMALSKDQKQQHANPYDSNVSRCLYVSNLAPSVTEDILRNRFSVYGTVSKCRVITGPRRYGFVEFVEHEEAETALRGLNGVEIDGKLVTVEFSRTPSGMRGRGRAFADPYSMYPYPYPYPPPPYPYRPSRGSSSSSSSSSYPYPYPSSSYHNSSYSSHYGGSSSSPAYPPNPYESSESSYRTASYPASPPRSDPNDAYNASRHDRSYNRYQPY